MRRLHLAAVFAGALLAACARAREPTVRANDQSLQIGPPGGDMRGELAMRARVDEITLSPDGRVWMADRQGEIFAADSVDGDWRVVQAPPPEVADSFELEMYLPNFDRVTFVDARTGFASGFATRGQGDVHDAILRTTDGGASWDTVSFHGDDWIYTVFVDARGGVWMGGSSGALYHSADAGATWETRARPFDGSSRLSSVWMEGDGTGVTGALGNGMKVTADSGRSWRAIPTPMDQGRYAPSKEEYAEHRVGRVAVFHGSLLAEQEGHLFASPRDHVRWRELPGPQLGLYTVDRKAGRVYAVDTAQRTYEIGADLAPRLLNATPLRAPAADLAARAGEVVALDHEGGLYRISRSRFAYTMPLTVRRGAPEVERVRMAGGRLWGSSRHGLFVSDDSARTWRRMGEVPWTIRGTVAVDRDHLLVWDGHGNDDVFDARTGRLAPVSGLHGDDVVDVVTAPGMWVAYGGRQYETADRIEVAQSFSGGEFAGSRPNGFVYVSRDSGRTWTRADEWKEHGVADVFVHPGGEMTLISWLGSIRRLTPAAGGSWRGEDRIVATRRNLDAVPYVQTVGALYFSSPDDGFVDGWIHHVGNRRFATHDGGRTWQRDTLAAHHFDFAFPVASGMVGVTRHGAWLITPARDRALYDAGGREVRYDSEYDLHRTISDAGPADGGRVVVLTAAGEIRLVDPARGTAPLVGRVALPRP